MADWSQLPTELLQLIANRLNSDFYILRFRSVCSTWRSSTTFPNPNHHQKLPSKIPLISNDFNPNDGTFSLSKRTLFLIFPPPQNPTTTLHHHPWLIKINNSNNQLLYPLSHYSRFPSDFPHILDFNNLSVTELGHEFFLDHAADLYSLPFPVMLNNHFLKKVVVVFEIELCFVLLGIHASGKLAVFRCSDDRWTIIPETPTRYDAVCVFKGKPIVVDRNGKTVRVRVGVGIEPELGLDLVADPVFGGDKKYLVESNGELLLVDKHWVVVDEDDYDDDDDDDDDEEEEEDNGERAVKFNVYRLDEKEKRWVELTSLGDRTLFLGGDCAFSLPASDLGSSSCFGNCVIFRDCAFNKFKFEMRVFDLDIQKSTPLQKDYRGHCDLFMPPEWVRSR